MSYYSQMLQHYRIKLRGIRGAGQPQTADRRRSAPDSVTLDTMNETNENQAARVQEKKIWKEAFKGFYKKYSRPLWFYIYKTCSDGNLADDILQDAFYRYLRAEPLHLNEYQQKAYLYKIATNLVIDHLRKVKRNTERESENDPRAEQGFDDCKQHEVFLAMDMEKLFKKLKPRERTLLWLAYIEGYSHKEIAGITGISEKSMKVNLFRARKKFAGILKREGYQPVNAIERTSNE